SKNLEEENSNLGIDENKIVYKSQLVYTISQNMLNAKIDTLDNEENDALDNDKNDALDNDENDALDDDENDTLDNDENDSLNNIEIDNTEVGALTSQLIKLEVIDDSGSEKNKGDKNDLGDDKNNNK
ncbi:20782_t:CDS:2, partial [Gigaspora margarita]